MSHKQKAVERAKELGVTLEIGGTRYMEVNLSAPDGKILKGPQMHMTVNVNNGHDAEAMWKAVLDDMAQGLEDCENQECDICEH